LNTRKSNAINLGLVGGPQLGISVGSRLLSTGNGNSGAILAVKKHDLGLAYGQVWILALTHPMPSVLGWVIAGCMV